MKVVVSIHDVSPYFNSEIEIILNELEGVKKSLLVTPLWNESNTFNKDFISRIAGEELVLHGLTHRTYKKDYIGKLLLMSTSSFKEFYQLSQKETRDKIAIAMELFQDSFHKSPTGFIPPMWYHNQYSIELLKEFGFCYTESTTAFINLQTEQKIRTMPMCFDFGNNQLLNYISVYGWKYFFKHIKQPLLRLSIHPADVKHGFLPDIIDLIKWLQDQNYLVLNANELIKY